MPVIGAFMVPHPPIAVAEVGRGEEEKIRATLDAYEAVAGEVRNLTPDTIVISSPHNVMYADYFNISDGAKAKGDLSQFRAPGVKADLEYDRELVQEICERTGAEDFPAGTMGQQGKSLDHGCMVPLYFIQNAYRSAGAEPDFRLVRIGLSGLPLTDHYRLGEIVREASDALGRRIVWIGSGDLSHKMLAEGPYGYDAAGPVYDEKIMDVMGRAAFGELFDFSESLCDKAAECGHRSFVMMAGALDRTAVRAEALSHEATFGVGYGICRYEIQGADASRNFLDQYREKAMAELNEKRSSEDGYVRLARKQVEAYINSGTRLKIPEDLPADLTAEERSDLLGRAAGVFVSLHKQGSLRGCIGTISATASCIAEEICRNAVSACTRDPRFNAVAPAELSELEYSVDVLGEAEKIDSADELDPARYGVIVEQGFRRGLLLPNLDGVDTVEQQIDIACQKAGITNRRGMWMKRFEVVRHY